jgi:MFS superfamily sulfate permease-like transporter
MAPPAACAGPRGCGPPRRNRKRFLPASVIALRQYSLQTFTADLIAGVTVGLVALPLAMAFAISSGMPPQTGIYTAIATGFVISSNVELFAQGVANIVSPMFGGLPATGAIARTATNIRSGAKTPVADLTVAVETGMILAALLFIRRISISLTTSVSSGLRHDFSHPRPVSVRRNRQADESDEPRP